MTAWFQAWLTSTGLVHRDLILILLIALPLMLAVAMIIYADRKIWAAMALRRGPNVVGPFGLLQSFADGLKVFLKETIIPSAANQRPVPDRADHHLHGRADRLGGDPVRRRLGARRHQCRPALPARRLARSASTASSSPGWASNSKYPFYSAMRAAAQMVSYEVSIGFVLISVVLWAGIVQPVRRSSSAQQGHVLGFVNGFGFNPLLFPMAVIFLISAMAETARAPFDLTEAESELVAGYQTEY